MRQNEGSSCFAEEKTESEGRKVIWMPAVHFKV